MSKLQKACPHLGVEHPLNFQCGDCDDSAHECNCHACGMVFCDKCQELLFIDCDDVRMAWHKNNPDKDRSIEAFKIQTFCGKSEEMKTEFEFVIHDISLGIKEAEDPKNDRSQHLVVDDFKVFTTDKNRIIISVKKHHIKEYDVGYCVDCLEEGVRNRKCPYGHFSKTEKWNRCVNHYASYMRIGDSKNACPKCEEGYLTTCGVEGENRCCTHCEHVVYGGSSLFWLPIHRFQ